VRYDLGARPLPAIPLPNDSATWPDPTSRTGLRINASLIAPTNIERQARTRFSQMEGWGTFAPLSVSFDIDRTQPGYEAYEGPALNLDNVRQRHQGDDYDFKDDAVYLVNLKTGVPMALDLGTGNFNYTLKKLDKYWANDTRYSERNLLFETIDETQKGAVTSYDPQYDSDFDGTLDRPNLVKQDACPPPDAVCDNPESGSAYDDATCLQKRRARDQCVADNLLDWYERETDTLILRPLLPLDEMTRYAVVVTDRLRDGKGNPVRSPFPFVYHAAQRHAAQGVMNAINAKVLANYWGDIAGTGLEHVAFMWSFTTQPTVDDMKRLRDGLYGQGPFARWAEQYPPELELQRAVGLTNGLANGATDPQNWQTSDLGKKTGCEQKAKNLWIVDYEGLKPQIKQLLVDGFGLDDGPAANLLLRRMDAIDHMVIATFKAPFLLEGGPKSTDPNSAFHLNYVTGEGDESSDTVQAWIIVPKETAKHKQPFDVNIYGHGYTGNFIELVLYAGNMAQHGIATVGINAMGHGLVFESEGEKTAAAGALGGACFKPLYDAFTLGRTRDLDLDGIQDSGGDFWSSYLFHTRDGVRQSILDHIQLVRILRAFGTAGMSCRDDNDKSNPVRACDPDGDGKRSPSGDFDNNGKADIGGPQAKYGTWGESLGGILSAIHGSIDAYVTSAVPGSGGGGLTDIGVRSFQGGVIEAVLLRIWGPLLVTVPASTREPCKKTSKFDARCTICAPTQMSLRWVLPNVNGTGEVEVECIAASTIANTTVLVRNLDNDEVRCASVDDKQRFRIGLPTSAGDRVTVSFWEGKHAVGNYKDCNLTTNVLRHSVVNWGPGRFGNGETNGVGSESCQAATCAGFQGHFFGEGGTLTAPGDGYGIIRQTPSLRRFLGLAQAALEPGDPISFAPFYALKQMTDPFGNPIAPHAMLTLNTIGDMNVPLNSGIQLARATGALPFLRPDQAALYPEYIDYVTPQALYDSLGGRTPNRELIDRHVIEGITALARHPAGSKCATSANAQSANATWLDVDEKPKQCFPTGCTMDTEKTKLTRVCYPDTHCDFATKTCVPNQLGQKTCDEALWDADDLDENKQLYFEQFSPVPHRLARLTGSATQLPLDQVWAPRLKGRPFSQDSGAYVPQPAPGGRLTALLDAYTVPQGEHTFVNGEPCQSFDHGTYLTNLVARFFQSDGTDIYYLSHPSSHHCLATQSPSCDYQK
jgi:translation initiation factor IF-1